MPAKNTPALSLPQSATVRGYQIKRLPIGGYLRAMERLRELPGDLMSACFPGQGLGEILVQLKQIDEATLQSIIGNALLATPKHIVGLIADLTEIPEEALHTDPVIGLDGLMEILLAWTEVNGIGDFLSAVRTLIGRFRAAGFSRQPITGSSD